MKIRLITKLTAVWLIIGSACFPANADDGIKSQMADFFGVSENRVHIECSQKSFSLTEEAGGQVLEMCLAKSDKNNKRCEIAIHGLKRTPAENKLSFEVNYQDFTPRQRWQSIMQIHSFPDKDKGEQWRCPVVSFEVKEGKYRLFNRWDASPVSKVSGYNCTEAGNSISSREVIKDLPVMPGQWRKLDLKTALSYGEDGSIRASLGDNESELFTGPTTYNDRRDPFLKFGIYKPAGWDKDHEKVCVRYRNVKIVTSGE